MGVAKLYLPCIYLARPAGGKMPAGANGGNTQRDGDIRMKTVLMSGRHSAMLEACTAAHQACTSCAYECCGRAGMTECWRLCRACASMCAPTADMIARCSRWTVAMAELCARMCPACADECAKHDDPSCRECAEACRRCAEQCRQMMASAQ